MSPMVLMAWISKRWCGHAFWRAVWTMSAWRRASLERRVPMWMVLVLVLDEGWGGGGCGLGFDLVVVGRWVSTSVDVIALVACAVYP